MTIIEQTMACRLGCAACCIAPSISSSIPGMERGKPAGIPCVQLNESGLCKLFGKPERPKVCLDLKPCFEMCQNDREAALEYLGELEALTSPKKGF